MGHAAKFWAAKLPASQHVAFWNLVKEWNFSGETAYCRIMDGQYLNAQSRA